MRRTMESRYTRGWETEHDLIGEFTLNERAREELSKIQKENGYVRFQEAMDWVERNYERNPSDPRPRFANDLHTMVAEGLGIEDYNELKFYSTVGTPLDKFHSVDGYFRFKNLIVTVDITQNESKADRGYRADVVIFQNSETDIENREIYKEMLDRYSKVIIEEFKQREKEGRQNGVKV